MSVKREVVTGRGEPPARMTMHVPFPHGLLISVGCLALVDPA